MKTAVEIIEILLKNRQVVDRDDFLSPNYERVMMSHDPFELIDMDKAVERLVLAHQQQQKIVIFGDYDADGVTATALLLDALACFGFERVDYFLPNRFTNGYGMTVKAVEQIVAEKQPDLIITVDCGSLNQVEIERANQLGVDVIVTDHHNVAEVQPPAVAVVNPKRTENTYPNRSLSGVGTAFTLVRALQTRLEGLAPGQEKWLLDLVAIGTIADLMELQGENRALVKFGLMVLTKTRRPGLKHLLDQNKLEQLTAETVGFVVGPRINASGRLEAADFALEVLTAQTLAEAHERVEKLNYLNTKRRALQDKVYGEAFEQATESNDPVLVLAGDGWHEGVVGIVASRIQEEFQKPVFILGRRPEQIKGSARSFGQFSVFETIEACRDLLLTGGGHDAAGGLSFKPEHLEAVRTRINNFYRSLNLKNQQQFLEPKPEIKLDSFAVLNKDFYHQMRQLEPFGAGNPEPIFEVVNLTTVQVLFLGSDNQHLKIRLRDSDGRELEMICFNYNKEWKIRLEDRVKVIFTLSMNYWNGRETLQGRLLRISKI